MFHLSPYLDSIEQAQMAETLGIQKTALQNWFKNKRYRLKKRQEAGDKEVLPQNEINDYCKVEPRHEESFGFAKFI